MDPGSADLISGLCECLPPRGIGLFLLIPMQPVAWLFVSLFDFQCYGEIAAQLVPAKVSFVARFYAVFGSYIPRLPHKFV